MHAATENGGDARAKMDAIYRWQVGIYDLTRKHYLLGRDDLIAALRPPAAGAVLEVGCGTGRNLVLAARRYPAARFDGIDVSPVMLETAGAAVARADVTGQVRLAVADATSFEPRRVFGRATYDRVYFSYTLSMIPPWREALANAVTLVAPGGELHVVDFGGFERLPRLSRAIVYRWLSLFHVEPRLDLAAESERLTAGRGARVDVLRPFRGYAQRIVIRF